MYVFTENQRHRSDREGEEMTHAREQSGFGDMFNYLKCVKCQSILKNVAKARNKEYK